MTIFGKDFMQRCLFLYLFKRVKSYLGLFECTFDFWDFYSGVGGGGALVQNLVILY